MKALEKIVDIFSVQLAQGLLEVENSVEQVC
jgi:hypothetical protein